MHNYHSLDVMAAASICARGCQRNAACNQRGVRDPKKTQDCQSDKHDSTVNARCHQSDTRTITTLPRKTIYCILEAAWAYMHRKSAAIAFPHSRSRGRRAPCIHTLYIWPPVPSYSAIATYGPARVVPGL